MSVCPRRAKRLRRTTADDDDDGVTYQERDVTSFSTNVECDVSSGTDPDDDDVVDVTSFSAPDVVEINTLRVTSKSRSQRHRTVGYQYLAV